MKSILYDEIPSLNLADFYKGDASQKQKFVEALGAAYTNIGFVAILNHFLTDDLQNRLYAVILHFPMISRKSMNGLIWQVSGVIRAKVRSMQKEETPVI
jgi:isopenicillin N synthase-like dioxygenase